MGGREKEGEAGGEGGGGALVAPPAAGVRRLLLTGNRLGDAGARALASALKKDRSLEVLDLSRCCFCFCLVVVPRTPPPPPRGMRSSVF